MSLPGEKRRLRDILYRPAIHPGWLPPEPPPTIWERWGRRRPLHPAWTIPPSRPEPANPPRPTRRGARAFTPDEVRAIRAAYRPHDPDAGAPALARLYGVNRWTIRNIVVGRVYQRIA